MNRLFEAVLNEADKSRFIKKAFQAHFDRDENHFEDIPEDEITKWVNSGAADSYRIDWNQDSYTLYDSMINAYDQWQKKHREQQSMKNERKKVAFATLEDERLFKLLDENDEFSFYAILCWDAAKAADGKSIGDKGAKWCIGEIREPHFWNKYISQGCKFVMAVSKNVQDFGTDNVKYMLQFKANSELVVWRQTDKSVETFGKERADEMFNIDTSTLYNKVSKIPMDIEKSDTAEFTNLVDMLEFMQNDIIWTYDDTAYCDDAIHFNLDRCNNWYIELSKIINNCQNKERYSGVVINSDQPNISLKSLTLDYLPWEYTFYMDEFRGSIDIDWLQVDSMLNFSFGAPERMHIGTLVIVAPAPNIDDFIREKFPNAVIDRVLIEYEYGDGTATMDHSICKQYQQGMEPVDNAELKNIIIDLSTAKPKTKIDLAECISSKQYKHIYLLNGNGVNIKTWPLSLTKTDIYLENCKNTTISSRQPGDAAFVYFSNCKNTKFA